jgi:hypothetical protein
MQPGRFASHPGASDSSFILHNSSIRPLARGSHAILGPNAASDCESKAAVEGVTNASEEIGEEISKKVGPSNRAKVT